MDLHPPSRDVLNGDRRSRTAFFMADDAG